MVIFLVTLVIILLIGGMMGVGIYNGLITARNAFKNTFAQIDVQLQRRFDLIPNLVETAKAYMAHERETLEAIVKARVAAQAGLSAARADLGDSGAMGQLAATQGQLNSVLGRFLAVAEAHPDLKANQNMMQLTEELSSTENKVAFARQAYNDAVMIYNNKREVFPSSVVASLGGFEAAVMLEIAEEQREQVRQATRVEF